MMPRSSIAGTKKILFAEGADGIEVLGWVD